MPKQVSVTEAFELMKQGKTYIDVRSAAEFEQSHPAGAINVPLIDYDEFSGQMEPNPDFLRVMQANFPADTALLIGCQVGGRSMRAAQILESFGFQDVSNVRGGFDGACDPMSGRMLDPGWADSGLPVEAGAPEGRRYEDLLSAADRKS